MKSKTNRKNFHARLQWIAGIALVILIVTAVILVNPKFQQGFFRLPSSRELFREAMNRFQLPNCERPRDIRISLGPDSPGTGRYVLSNTPGISTIGQFTITPQNCIMNMQTLEFDWVDILRTGERNFNAPNIINMDYPRATSNARSGEFEVIFNPEPSLLCMQGADLDSMTLRSRDSVTFSSPITIAVSGTLFASPNVDREGVMAENSRYNLRLTHAGNIFTNFSFPEYSFTRSTPMNDHFANFCASAE